MTPAQLDLFDGSAPEFQSTSPAPSLCIQHRFALFHLANPWVYDALVVLVRDLVASGHRKVGIKMCIEVLRWQWYRATDDPTSGWKLNNSYSSRYARLIADTCPDLAKVFEFRELTEVAA